MVVSGLNRKGAQLDMMIASSEEAAQTPEEIVKKKTVREDKTLLSA